MTISEPMTLLTDYLLAALVLAFAARLAATGRRQGQKAVLLWGAAFAASGLAALAGGTVHGFVLYLGEPAAAALWKVTVYLVGLAGLLLLSACAVAILTGAARRGLILLAALKFAGYVLWMASHDDFRYVIYDYAPALLAVLLLQIYAALRRRDPAAPWVVGGILVSFLGAGIQAAGLAPHPHFNHNDLYHVMQMGAFYLLYRGGLLLRDR